MFLCVKQCKNAERKNKILKTSVSIWTRPQSELPECYHPPELKTHKDLNRKYSSHITYEHHFIFELSTHSSLKALSTPRKSPAPSSHKSMFHRWPFLSPLNHIHSPLRLLSHASDEQYLLLKRVWELIQRLCRIVCMPDALNSLRCVKRWRGREKKRRIGFTSCMGLWAIT